MSVALPEHLDPWRAVQSGLSFEGVLHMDQLARLSAIVLASGEEVGAPVEYRLVFGLDEEGRPVVDGFVRARVRLRCQRCLGDVDIAVESTLRLLLVRTDEAAANILADFDPLVVSEDGVRLADLVEDELLLALPPVPRHAEGDCRPPGECGEHSSVRVSEKLGASTHAVDDLPDRDKRANPFAVLASLKADRNT